MADVSPSVAACMSDMAAKILALRRAEAELAAVRELLEGASVLEIDFRLRDRILAVIGDVIGAGDSQPAEDGQG